MAEEKVILKHYFGNDIIEVDITNIINNVKTQKLLGAPPYKKDMVVQVTLINSDNNSELDDFFKELL